MFKCVITLIIIIYNSQIVNVYNSQKAMNTRIVIGDPKENFTTDCNKLGIKFGLKDKNI